MSEISIDREVLRRILKEHLRLEAATDAWLNLTTRARLSHPESSEQSLRLLELAQELKAAHEREMTQLQVGRRYLEHALLDSLDGSDDAAFLRELYRKFPERSHSEE
jgi:hypothetical protein